MRLVIIPRRKFPRSPLTRLIYNERDVYLHSTLGKVTVVANEGSKAIVSSQRMMKVGKVTVFQLPRIHKVDLYLFEKCVICRLKVGKPYKEGIELVENTARKPIYPDRPNPHFVWRVKSRWFNCVRRFRVKSKEGRITMIKRSQIYRRGY